MAERQQPWAEFPATYRQAEIRRLAQWLAAGQSGSVVGLPGCGRSNLLDFLCYRMDAWDIYTPTLSDQLLLVPLNLLTLPAADIATFYRGLLRAAYQVNYRFPPALRATVESLYQTQREKSDPFLPQSAWYEFLLTCQTQGVRVVLVLNYFNRFVDTAPEVTVNTLRGLRDSFKHTLQLLVGLSQALAYLPDPDRLGELYELLDRNVCWVGALTEPDARNLIARTIGAAAALPAEAECQAMLRLSGNFPALLKSVASWWVNTTVLPPLSQWLAALLAESSIQYRLTKVWRALTQEEQFVLAEVSRQPAHSDWFTERYYASLTTLVQKGVCCHLANGWQVQGELLAAQVQQLGPTSRGRLWLAADTQVLYQGRTPLRDLTPLEARLLRYFIQRPRQLHTKDELLAWLWPDKSQTMIDNDLQQLISRLRKKIDTTPPQYIVTWKGDAGGYQFYPEGRPD